MHWKGYGAADDLWLPAKDVSGVRHLVVEFHQQNPEAPQHILAAVYATLPFQTLENFTEIPKQCLFDWTEGRNPTRDTQPPKNRQNST